MPGKLCIIDNIGLHRRIGLLLSQAVALLIIRNVWLCRDSNPTGLFVYTTKHDKNDDLDSFRTSMLVSHDTLRALLEAFHLHRVTELPSSTNTLSWQYYLPWVYPLVV